MKFRNYYSNPPRRWLVIRNSRVYNLLPLAIHLAVYTVALIVLILFGWFDKSAQDMSHISLSSPISHSDPVGQQPAMYAYSVIHDVNPELPVSEAMRLATALDKYSQKFDIDMKWALAEGVKETRFDKWAISKSNALGYFQVIPKWHFGVLADAKQATGKSSPFDPEIQAYMVCRILHDYRDKRGSMVHAVRSYYGSSEESANREYQQSVYEIAKTLPPSDSI